MAVTDGGVECAEGGWGVTGWRSSRWLNATFLGVGGSVMTVPLLRRCGLSMSQATSMTNPLSVPVALAGTLIGVMKARCSDLHS